MELDDFPAVFALGERLFTAEMLPNLYRSWDEYELLTAFASDREFCLVADYDGRVVGFALGALMEKRHSAWNYGWLQWLGVDPEIKGRGVGRRLLNVLTELFIDSGVRMMLLDTEADNYDALKFFQSHGFGNEIEHVYLSRNLTDHPAYVRRRAERKQAAKKSSRRRGPGVIRPEPHAPELNGNGENGQP